MTYYAGQLKRTLLQWLATRQRAARIVHFPDYDGVGLANYTRLHTAVGDACQLWLMPEWQAKLQRFGSNSLWQASYRDFAAACAAIPPRSQAPGCPNETAWPRVGARGGLANGLICRVSKHGPVMARVVSQWRKVCCRAICHDFVWNLSISVKLALTLMIKAIRQRYGDTK